MNSDREQSIRAALQHELQRLSAGEAPLDLVEDIPILESFVDDYAQARIADARSLGASWADIAARLGVSRQAVHKRFTSKREGRRRRAVIELRFQRSDD
ncbi:MAG: TetR family transcriptional regulator [Acidimicrobiia bacterium]|nr:TetR family transcriptional regulator [Acidimicrobiia bacterium]